MPTDGSATSIEGFQYPQSGLPVHSNWLNIATVVNESEVLCASGAQVEQSDGELSTEVSLKTFEDGRREGIDEGRRIERLEQEARMEQFRNREIEMAARLNERFADEHDRFLRAAEPEIMKLALRVAERIVRREVQVDPLLLTGAIRVALGQLADKATTRVHVPAKDAELWNETLAHVPNLRLRPTIIADQDLEPGECRLESSLGSVDLSIHSQLQEIARSLLGRSVDELGRDTLHAETRETML